MKKALSVILSILMIITTISALPFSAQADYETYYVVGDSAEIFGTMWDASNSDNIMEPDGEGKYTKSYTVSKPYKKVMLKVYNNGVWHGDELGNNYAFKIKEAGTFTVSFDTSTNKIEVSGSVVGPVPLDYSSVYVVGNGSGSWLNGVAWEPGNSANKMTEISQDVWQIEYDDVPAGLSCVFKFAIDGSFATNFGGTVSASGVTENAIYNADDNISFTTTEVSNVSIILDLSDYDPKLKQGAKFTVTYGPDEPATYYDGELGAIYSPERTVIKYWAPQAKDVKIEFYDTIFTEPLAMQKLKDGGKWTGVWTYTLDGYTYGIAYDFIVDGVKCSDPYGKANTNADDGKTSIIPVSDITPYDWENDCHIFYDDGEASGVMYYLDIDSFMSNPNSGCSDMDRGKYYSLISTGTTVDNEGNIPTGMTFLDSYSDADSVCLDIANTDSQLMIPDCEYSYNTYDAGSTAEAVKIIIKELHDRGIAVYLAVDFSSVNSEIKDDMLTKYIIDTCTFWANEYHIDGFVLEKMISPENETALKAALDEIDSRFFLAGTSKNRLIKDDWLISVDETLPTVSPIPAYFVNGMSARTSLYNRYTLNMSDLQMTIATMCRGRLALKLGQEFGGFGASVDWSKLGSTCDTETGEPVFDHSYSYFRKLVEIRKAFAPLYSAKGTQQVKSSGNTVECNYTNAVEHEGEWEKLKVLINLYSNDRSFTNTDNWVVIAKEGTVDYNNGLDVINGTNISVPAKSAMILVDKASFDELNAPPPISYNITVCGTAVTSANAADVFGDGTVSFNPETNILTLNNANITTSDSFIYSINRDLNIELIGNNDITVTGYSNGIVFNRGAEESAKLSFTGSGTLNLGSESGKGIDLRGTMLVDGPSVNVHSTGIAISTTENSDIIVDSGSLNIKSDENYGIFNYIFGDNKGSIEVNGGTLTVESALGGTNIDDISFSGVEYNEGTDLSQSGKVSVGKHIHHTTKVPAKAATAEKAGNKEYYTCTCGKMFEDSQGTKEITEIPLVEFVHTLKKIPAKAATTEKEGNKEYYVCTCGKLYEDAAGTKEIKDSKSVVIPKIVLPPADAKLPTEKKTENTIKKTNTDKNDVSGAQIKQLMLKATAKNQTITLSWKKINGAQGYIIYGGPCGKDMKRLATVKNGKTVKKTFKKLKKGKYYKYMVVAYKKTADGNNRVICKSKSVHCCTDGGKKGNPISISVKKAKLTVKKGKTVKIQPTLKIKKKVDTHIAKFRYESSNTKIATVDKNGKVKGVKKGTATIYVYAQDGKCKTVKITVK